MEGPFDELVLQQALANGTMVRDQMCCREGSEDWTPASVMFLTAQPASPPVSAFLSVTSSVQTVRLMLRWRWSYLFWAPVSFYFLMSVYGCVNIGNAIQNIEQLKANAEYELGKR